jgi:hypothetical protein
MPFTLLAFIPSTEKMVIPFLLINGGVLRAHPATVVADGAR